MPIRFYSPGKRRKPSKVVRPSKKRDEALQKQMAQAVTLRLGQGFTRMRQGVSSDRLADAYLSGDYSRLIKEVPLKGLADLLGPAMEELAKAGGEGAARGAAFVPNAKELRYDLVNPAIQQYVSGRQGALIQNVTDQFQQTVSGLVQRRFASGLSDKGIEMGLLDKVTRNGVTGYVLKQSLGLDTARAGALATKAASGQYTQAQMDKFTSDAHQSRAATIARTEVSYAINQGQLDVWNEAQKQDLLPAGAMKVWTVDAAPCPICQPMDGIAVPLADNFILPNGEQVMTAPAHPRCLCLCTLMTDENDDTPLNR